MCDLHQSEEEGAPKSGITEFIDELVVATTNSQIYWNDHPRVKSSIAALLRCIKQQSTTETTDKIVLGSAEGFLFYKRRPLLGASLSAAKVIESFKSVEAGGMSVSRRVSEHDFLVLVDVLASAKKGYASFAEANHDLLSRGCKHIQFLPEYRGGDFTKGTPDAGLLAALGDTEVDEGLVNFDIPVELYQQTVALLQDAMVRVCHGEDINIEQAQGFVESILERLSTDAISMMGIARYERYDAYTFGHSIRVCFLALYFAASLFDDEELLLRIGLAALLHDIGKAWVPFEVLHSTKRLTKEERFEMNKHTTHGGEILLKMVSVDPLSVSTAFSHHQTLDGGGYPQTIHRVRQSIGTRIIKICDVYEALTAVRPYKPRMPPVRAYRIMISMKNHFDPVLLRRFIASNGIFPIGSLVQLSTGEQARILKQTADPHKPIIKIEFDELGSELGPDETLIRDLNGAVGGPPSEILKIVDSAA
jgi:putative nucleotidyltransferase with HDIG domain